jgi:hypothetical protein
LAGSPRSWLISLDILKSRFRFPRSALTRREQVWRATEGTVAVSYNKMGTFKAPRVFKHPSTPCLSPSTVWSSVVTYLSMLAADWCISLLYARVKE